MISIAQLAGLAVILVAAGALIAYQVRIGKKGKPAFRRMPAFDQLRKAIGLAVENGSRIHITLGKSGLTQPSVPSALKVKEQNIDFITPVNRARLSH